jgi:ABC-type multidrug transport system fused ATPase/permease subunit
VSLDERAVKFIGFNYTQPTFSCIISGGKSTLALSFFRFVEATEGKILIDGINIADVGLADLRSRLTIIPRACRHFPTLGAHRGSPAFSRFEEDPTILSGSLRSTLDVFNEYEDVEIVRTLSHGDLTIDLTLNLVSLSSKRCVVFI